MRHQGGGSGTFWIVALVLLASLIAIVVPLSIHFVNLNSSNDSFDNSPSLSSATSTLTFADSSTQSSQSSPLTTFSRTSSIPSGELNQLEFDFFIEHNNKRALHGVGNLTWNWELAQFAADYAASALDCNNLQLIHSGGPYGENLAAGYEGGFRPVDVWYDEISLYDYDNPGFAEETGHFTQVIWNATNEVGCAYVDCHNQWSQYTICEYRPAGNIVGSTDAQTRQLFNENVPRPLS